MGAHIMASRIARAIVVFVLCSVLASNAYGKDSELIVTHGVLTAKSAISITVDAVEYALTGQTELEDALGNHISLDAFSLNDVVKAKGSFVDGVLTAIKLELEVESHNQSPGDDQGGTHEIEIEGLVSAVSTSDITVQNKTFQVDQSTIVKNSDKVTIALSAIAVGDKVSIKAMSNAPTLAKVIILDGRSEEESQGGDNGDNLSSPGSDTSFLGVISEITPDSLTIGQTLFKLAPSVRVEGTHHRLIGVIDLKVGDLVEVEFYVSGNEKIARKIDLEDESNSNNEGAFELKGPISELTADSITVRGVVARLDSNTQFTLGHGVKASKSNLHLGDLVKGSRSKLVRLRMLQGKSVLKP